MSGAVRSRRATFTPADGPPIIADVAGAPNPKARVVVVLGAPSRRYMTARLRRLAPPDIEIACLLRAGYGGPSFGPGARPPVLDFDEQSAALEPAIEASDLPTVLVGVSYGGLIALNCALTHSQRVVGVATLAALVSEPRPWLRSILPAGETPPLRAALPASLKTALAEVKGRRGQVEPLLARLSALSCPVSILHGDLDPLVPLSDAEALAARLPSACAPEVLVAKGASHYLELERPRWVWSVLRDLFARAGVTLA